MLDRTVRFLACLLVALLASRPRRHPLAAQAGSPAGHRRRTAAGPRCPTPRSRSKAPASGPRTGANGGYEIRGVPPGTHTVRVRLIGFQAGDSRGHHRGGRGGARRTSRSAGARSSSRRSTWSSARAPATRRRRSWRCRWTSSRRSSWQQQGSTETSVILQAVSPSINFPRQSVTDAGDIVRPFTLRGLSPDHTLVLVNGWRRHQTALVNNFTYGMGAGSSGVDLNAIPSSALDRIEVLRDGAAAQYGSDAIAGVVNLVLKDGAFTPFVNGDVGRYTTDDYPDDGTTVNVNGGWGIRLGRGSLGLFGEFRDRQPTNRAWADPFEVAGTGVADSINDIGQVVHKNNPVPQPNHHWGDGLEKDALALRQLPHAGQRRRAPARSTPSAATATATARAIRTGATPAAPGTGTRSTRSASCPTIEGLVTDYSLAGGLRGVVSGWNYDARRRVRPQPLRLPDQQHAQRLARARAWTWPCAPGADGDPGHRRRPGHPEPAQLLRRPGAAGGVRSRRSTSPSRSSWGCRTRSTWRSARRSGASATRSGRASWPRTSTAAPPIRPATAPAPGGSQSFPGFAPGDATDRHRTNFGLYADAETNLSEKVLADVAARFEDYSDFGSRRERQGGGPLPAVAPGHAPRARRAPASGRRA